VLLLCRVSRIAAAITAPWFGRSGWKLVYEAYIKRVRIDRA